MLFASFLIIAYSQIVPNPLGGAPCAPQRVEIAALYRDLFLDPSEATRAAVSKRLLKVASRRKWRRCFDLDGLVALAPYTDRNLVIDAWERDRGEERTFAPRWRSRHEITDRDLDVARSAVAAAGSGDVHPWALKDLVLANDPLADAALARMSAQHRAGDEGQALVVWREHVVRYPDRRQRLSALLDLPTFRTNDDGWCAESLYGPNEIVRNWAIDDLVGSADPRTWHPEDVALVVAKAHEEDAKKDPSNSYAYAIGTDRYVDTQSNCGSPTRVRAAELALALAPMGVSRALELVHSFSRKSPPPPPHGKGYLGGFSEPYLHEHFPSERELYGMEWELAHPAKKRKKTAVPTSQRDAYVEQRTSQRNAYVEQRWVATDDAAPHPDMEQVRAAVEALLSKEKTP